MFPQLKLVEFGCVDDRGQFHEAQSGNSASELEYGCGLFLFEIAVKILCVLGEHNYANPSRGKCYEYVNFVPALRSLGHEIISFESFRRNAYHDFADLESSAYLIKCTLEKPDFILCVQLTYEIWPETFAIGA